MMTNKIKQMRAKGGFTLVELLVVILIIGILATLAIVAFQGSTDDARNTTAQANLRSAYAVAQNLRTTTPNGEFPAASVIADSITESGLNAVPGDDPVDNTVVVVDADTGGDDLKMIYQTEGGVPRYTIVTSAGTYNGTDANGTP